VVVPQLVPLVLRVHDCEHDAAIAVQVSLTHLKSVQVQVWLPPLSQVLEKPPQVPQLVTVSDWQSTPLVTRVHAAVST
jgi:hypothetical protein